MTPDQLTILRAELDTDPLLRGYKTMTVAEAVTDLNTAYITATRTRYVNARQIIAGIGLVGAIALKKAETFAATPQTVPELQGLAAAVGFAMDFIRSAEGIDINHEATRQVISGLVLAGVVSNTEAAALLSMAATTITRAEDLGLVKRGDETTAGTPEIQYWDVGQARDLGVVHEPEPLPEPEPTPEGPTP